MAQLVIDGDQFEKDFWSKFIKDKFSSYETFWLKYTLPLREDKIINLLEKLEIVSGVVHFNFVQYKSVPFRIFAGGFFRKNAFGLIQEYCSSEV